MRLSRSVEKKNNKKKTFRLEKVNKFFLLLPLIYQVREGVCIYNELDKNIEHNHTVIIFK